MSKGRTQKEWGHKKKEARKKAELKREAQG